MTKRKDYIALLIDDARLAVPAREVKMDKCALVLLEHL